MLWSLFSPLRIILDLLRCRPELSEWYETVLPNPRSSTQATESKSSTLAFGVWYNLGKGTLHEVLASWISMSDAAKQPNKPRHKEKVTVATLLCNFHGELHCFSSAIHGILLSSSLLSQRRMLSIRKTCGLLKSPTSNILETLGLQQR